MTTTARVRQSTAQLVVASVMLGALLATAVGALALILAPTTTCAPVERGPRVTVTKYTPTHPPQAALLA